MQIKLKKELPTRQKDGWGLFSVSKKNLVLINTARGGIIDEEELYLGSHCAASTKGAVDKMTEMAADNVLNFFRREGA